MQHTGREGKPEETPVHIKATWSGIYCAWMQADSAIRPSAVNRQKCVLFDWEVEKAENIMQEDLNKFLW